jgi:hypothetical protein
MSAYILTYIQASANRANAVPFKTIWKALPVNLQRRSQGLPPLDEGDTEGLFAEPVSDAVGETVIKERYDKLRRSAVGEVVALVQQVITARKRVTVTVIKD